MLAELSGSINAIRLLQWVLASDPYAGNSPTPNLLVPLLFELKRGRHQLAGQFVEVNCATLRGDTAASTLFGHVRGAFAGAQRDRPGLLRSADGGLLFLDEIGELGADEQAMLLHALEEKRFLPVGADAEALDLFDRAQLACVIRVCRDSKNLSEAGRRLFAVTRGKRKVANDADRLRKYLARFDLTWPCRPQPAS